MKVVLQAADRHKSNYHAFLYARRLLAFLPGMLVSEDLVGRVHMFCLKHPRDISGWSFLAFLLEREMRGCGSQEEAGRMRDRVISKTEGFVRDLGWKGASVDWVLKVMGAERGAGGEVEKPSVETREDGIG